MNIFLTGNVLKTELENLFESATEHLILITPYIRLHECYAAVLKTKKDNLDFKITVVFGKKENDFSKSIKQKDFNFFKDFPNIEIRHEKRLHTRYYANENCAILTSMNLYEYYGDNNIESGILTRRKLFIGYRSNNQLTNVTDQDTLELATTLYFDQIIEQSNLLFKRVPKFESSRLGFFKQYLCSVNEIDKLSVFFDTKPKGTALNKKRFEKYEQKTSSLISINI